MLCCRLSIVRKTLCIFLILLVFSKLQAQDERGNPSGIITHYSLGVEIGSNFLDIETLNSELDDLGLLTLDPYTNNFAFQGSLGMSRIEAYATLTLMATNSFSDLIDVDRLFLSSALRGTYVGVGVKSNIFSIFNKRLSAVASIDLNTAYYSLNVSKAVITDISAGPLLDSSHAILAHSDGKVVQPGIELLYAVIKKKNRFDIGFKLGYFYQFNESNWENQHRMKVIGLSPTGNRESFNFSLKMIYTISRCYDRSNTIPDW